MRARAAAATSGSPSDGDGGGSGGGGGSGDDGEHGGGEDGEGEADAADKVPEFDDLESAKTFTVHDVNGFNVMLMTTLTGVMERQRASAGVQAMIDRGYHTMYIYSDERDPSILAVFQPGQEGHILRLSGTHRLSPAASLELESTFNPKVVMGHRGTLKYASDDFAATLTAKSDQEGRKLDFAYHQMVTPSVTAGGSMASTLGAVWPVPTLTAVVPSVYGSYASGANTWLFRLSGGNATASLHLHRQADKTVELGTTLTVNAATLDTSCGVGMRMALGRPTVGPPSTLIVNASTDLKVAMSLSSSAMFAFATTQVLTILSATLDHRNQEHLVGAQFQFHY